MVRNTELETAIYIVYYLHDGRRKKNSWFCFRKRSIKETLGIPRD